MALQRSRTRLIAAMAFVALASVVFGWSSAGGLASSVTIAYSKGTFSGVVSAESPCQAGRSVTVTKVDGDDVGTAPTDNNGAWTLAKKKAKGKFFATVAASTVQGTGTGYGYGYDGGNGATTCDGGKSDTIKVKRKKHRGGGGGGGGGLNLDNLIERLNRLFDRLFPGL